MPTVDLSAPLSRATRPADEGPLEGLPRRLALTLAELRFLATEAGDAPLPFDLTAPSADTTLDDRLGRTRTAVDDQAYAAALASLHEPTRSLDKRGLVTDGIADRGVVGALGVLAKPRLALDLDVSVGGVHAKAWHRQTRAAVATLATTDGIVFELAWFDSTQWPDELARVAAVPEDVELEESRVPDLVDLPYELLDGCGEALRTQRLDLGPVLVSAPAGRVLDGDGRPVPDATVAPLVSALLSETHGRLRGLVAEVAADAAADPVADPAAEGAPIVGVVSWILLADGWRALRAHQAGDERRVEVRRVAPSDLASLLAPVLVGGSA